MTKQNNLENEVEFREGYWWPKKDKACWKFLKSRMNLPENISNTCPEKRVLIQAGGNAGLYVEKYVDGEQSVLDYDHIINEFALLRNKWLGVMKGFDQKQWQITNIVKLRVAGLDDASV